jgi:hypothetical protein
VLRPSGVRVHLLVVASLASLASAPAAAAIVVNEIHDAPSDKTVPEEFVELVNTGGAAVDLSGWHFSDGIDFTFPPGTTIAPGEHLVVAQDPARLQALYGPHRALGPFSGRLANEGEALILRSAAGAREDEVTYQRGFPWPTVGGTDGFSIELLHPALDNDLGGSWRAASTALDDSSAVIRAGETWRYKKGTAEASAPAGAWRGAAFDDSGWTAANLAIGYGEAFLTTVLGDMQGGYTTIYLRKTFEVADPASIQSLVLEAVYDDGFNAWVNGVHVAAANVPGPELAFGATASSAREDLGFSTFSLPAPAAYIVAGTNVLAVQLHNASLGGSSDAFLDARLSSSAGGGDGPTPGRRNAVYATNAPPHLRQVGLVFGEEPRSGEPVLVSVKATDDDGVASVVLEYQLVDPGSYVELGDPEYQTNWGSLAMNDEGLDGDIEALDDVWTVFIPGNFQEHRRLVRYRLTATDATGRSVRVPYADDPSPNFAYFVYDDIPPWGGAAQPGAAGAAGEVVEHSSAVMGGVHAYHLLTKRSSTEDSTWLSRYGGDNYLWSGTLVAHGKVYDHIRYRARGGVWRYAMGKNMWKFDFNRGHDFEARDDFDRRIETRWEKLNFSAIIQQGDYLHRGEQGLFESAGFRLFNLAGVEAPRTYFVTFRIIDEAEEVGATQYGGDFWGLYLALEQPDGRFLDEHGLADGNLYKMEGGTGDLNNQGPTAVTDRSDLNSFLSTYESTTPTDDWWRENLDLERYYGYRAIVEAIHHYDIGYGKNYFYYLNPADGRWIVLPWDLDLTWANNMFGNGEEPFKSRVLSRAAFSIEHKNRMREVRDLLYNTDQAYELLDELAAIVDDPGGAPSLVDADRARWDYNPIMVDGAIVNTSKAGHGRFYQSASPRTFPGMVQLMKSYVVSRGSWIDANIASDAAIPATPSVSYTGPAGHPIDRLTFRSSAFSDPQGSGTFAGIKWRVGEVTPDGAPAYDSERPRAYEIDLVWESPEITPFASDFTLPSSVLEIGRTYRVRARMLDASGRTSHWSAPVELTAGEPTMPFPQETSLRITEIMYHPAGGSDLEFVELKNIGEASLDLTNVSFTAGIEFDFAGGDVTELAPGEMVVVVENRVAFGSRYDAEGVLIAGEFERSLDNGGEEIVLTYGGNSAIHSFEFLDSWYPRTDGGGYSLVVVDEEAPVSSWASPLGWRESEEPGGSPGQDDGAGPVGGRQLPGDANQDGVLEVSDALAFLRQVLPGGGGAPPCEGPVTGGGNLALLDMTGEGALGLTDALRLLNFIFQNGPAPALGTSCVRITGCGSACAF